MTAPTISATPAVDEQYAERVRASFARQAVMRTIGAEITTVTPGLVEITLAYRPDLAQQNGFLHAGITTTIADSAGGYAALSVFGPAQDVLTTEIKLNLLAPADGSHFLARGRVIKSGKTLTVCQIEVHAQKDGKMSLCAYGLMTTMRMHVR